MAMDDGVIGSESMWMLEIDAIKSRRGRVEQWEECFWAKRKDMGGKGSIPLKKIGSEKEESN